MRVSNVLQVKGRAVATLKPGGTLSEAAAILAERRIGTVVITENDDRILGILSERDIVRAVAARGASALDMPISDHMTHEVKTTTLDEPVRSIMEKMTSGRFRHMPVVEEGRMVGIISIGDVVKHRVEEIEAEAHAMREYIASA